MSREPQPRTRDSLLRAAIAATAAARRSKTFSGSVVVILALAGAAGCEVPIGVRRLGIEKVFAATTSYALAGGVPSEFSIQVLQRQDLLLQFDEDPEAAIAGLLKASELKPERDLLFALAELSYIAGERFEKKPHYLDAVLFAYSYLFNSISQGAREPFDPRFRLACNIYNCALTQFLRAENGDVALESGIYETPFGAVTIEATHAALPWGSDEFRRFVPALDFSVRGLRSRNRNPGLGAPLIGIRSPPAKGDDQSDIAKHTSDYLARNAKVAATAILRPKSTEKINGHLFVGVSLEVYTPFDTLEIDIDGQKVPLEADFTAPLAYALAEPRIWDFEISGLLSGEVAGFENGIYLQQPYVPGKIPVVFVHGTASSPARWAEMFNELYSYRDLREKFQFWFFLYNTGSPIIVSASKLREALQEIVHNLDPEGKDPALRQMVVLGHSQGGLLTKMQAIDSGEVFFDEEVRDLVAKLRLTEPQTAQLRKFLVFQRLPFVSRVVFVSTPHQGSYLSGGWPSRLLSKLINAPKKVAQITHDLLTDSETGLPKGVALRIPTSIENMEPGNRFIVKLASIPVDPAVKVHSIIAVDAEGPLEDARDGVVAYSSAHIENVASEFIVHCGHSCQSAPLTILEVRRILLEHLNAVQGGGK